MFIEGEGKTEAIKASQKEMKILTALVNFGAVGSFFYTAVSV
jgi:hypothetical protein